MSSSTGTALRDRSHEIASGSLLGAPPGETSHAGDTRYATAGSLGCGSKTNGTSVNRMEARFELSQHEMLASFGYAEVSGLEASTPSRKQVSVSV